MIYILGNSGTGKTIIAQELAKKLNVGYLSASFWIREMFPDIEDPQILTKKTLEQLSINSNISFRKISWKLFDHHSKDIRIIEGLRNPDDFFRMYNPNKDFVIFLFRYDYNPITDFEMYGLKTIETYLKFKELLTDKILLKYVLFDRDNINYTLDKIMEISCLQSYTISQIQFQ